MTRPKSKRQDFGALLERVFHIKLSLSKSMLYGKHIGRGKANRTLNLRFWRPSLYQLSYTYKFGAR